MLENYARSYTNTAAEYEAANFPIKYESGDLKEGHATIEEYAEKRYFKNV